MDTCRRKFLKLAGISALGLGVKSAFDLLSPADAKALMPAESYKPDAKGLKSKQWAMVIDTTKFNKPEKVEKVIKACHLAHNVPTIPGKQEVKWLWTDDFTAAFPEYEQLYMPEKIHAGKFLLLCNHCEIPACVRVCPTMATFKREDGIVMMDMHRCIGCRFCMAACPYGARSFNFGDPIAYLQSENPDYPIRMRGVVEKCTFCTERLAVGKMPYCVEASEGAILFGDLTDAKSEVRKALRENFSIRRKVTLGTSPSVYYII